MKKILLLLIFIFLFKVDSVLAQSDTISAVSKAQSIKDEKLTLARDNIKEGMKLFLRLKSMVLDSLIIILQKDTPQLVHHLKYSIHQKRQ